MAYCIQNKVSLNFFIYLPVHRISLATCFSTISGEVGSDGRIECARCRDCPEPENYYGGWDFESWLARTFNDGCVRVVALFFFSDKIVPSNHLYFLNMPNTSPSHFLLKMAPLLAHWEVFKKSTFFPTLRVREGHEKTRNPEILRYGFLDANSDKQYFAKKKYFWYFSHAFSQQVNKGRERSH